MMIDRFLMLALTISALLLPAAAIADTQPGHGQQPNAAYVEDPHSFARPQEVAVKHLSLNLKVDFAKKQLLGTAHLTLDNKSGADKLYLDTRDLTIKQVMLDRRRQPAKFTLGPEPKADQKWMGRALAVDITPQTKVVHIEYVTSPDAAALQWLTPAMTTGKKNPFLFTQSQAVLARTWVPIQDTPGVRFTYDATVTVPKELLAVMSAENPQRNNADGVYRFRMTNPIPSYLLALSVGDLKFRALGKRTGVYAEPEVIKQAAWELADTEKMVEAAETIYGPYRWGRYDLLVLPPSFPFGGMENPRLTFATPTILAGDRSLVALVAHELAHSWSGNLVTNATWNDFWLNEGFTTYFEERIMEAVYGKEYADMLVLLGKSEAEAQVKELGAASPDTHLKLNLAGRDPDEGMNDIAYQKGALFLRTIEMAVGREKFDAFLRAWFDKNAFHSRTTEDFVEYLKTNLINGDQELAKKIGLQAWIYGPGLPANAPNIKSDRFAAVDAQNQAFADSIDAARLNTKGWSTHEWLRFLRSLPEKMTAAQMRDLDTAFKFSRSGNSEILNAWFVHVIRNQYEPGYAALEQFLTGMGRRKFLKPLYTELVKTPQGLAMAKRIYAEARPTYHPVSQGTIDAIIAEAEKKSA